MDHRQKHIELFNRIATPYQWFFNGQIRSYTHYFDLGRSYVGNSEGKRALDLGCGTGAFTTALHFEGWDAEGIDGAHAMVAQAGKSGLRCSRT